jgi:hypothetical protein
MRTWIFILLMAATAAFCADSDFNGRWDITINGPPKGKAWWLEVNGAGTPSMGGKFISAYAGDLNVIQEISLKNGELRFGFMRKERPQDGKPGRTVHVVYAARLVNGKLEGTWAIEGGKQPPVPWVGVRAPVIKDKDDGSWREGKPVHLFDGKDLKGWRALVPGRSLGWSVKDGMLSSTGHANNLISNAKFWNFILHLDYRVGPHSNSGIGLRGRYEVQILEDHGRPPNTHSNGALYSRIAPSVNASKPPSEWQTYDIRLVGRQVTVVLNGKTVIDKGEIEGLTAMASDPNEGEPGPISLQGDHGPVDFRNIVVTPLVK